MDNSDWIHFSLDGVSKDDPHKGFAQYVGRVNQGTTDPAIEPADENSTNWELYIDLTTPRLLGKTTFYRNYVRTGAPTDWLT
jgi:hypothetical protein